MTLFDLLKTCNHKMRIRIHFGDEDKFFDIKADQKEAFVNWIEYMGIYGNYEEDDVETWNVQNIAFVDWSKDGGRLETTERVLFVKMY